MESYYSTALHELTHWTGHSSRCARKTQRAPLRFLNPTPSRKLVAELGSAFLCAETWHYTRGSETDHAAYLASWLAVLKQGQAGDLRRCLPGTGGPRIISVAYNPL